MPLSNKWWILCAVLLSCLARFGSCRKAHGVPAEPVIFSELCALKDEPGPCRAIKDRYFFNVDSGRCELFEYGGCGGNQNNFETLEECEETCLVSDKKNPCHLPQAPGPCRGLVSRFFFDSSSQECKQFYYGGCFGNANNFRTMAECQAKCLNPVSSHQVIFLHLTLSLASSSATPAFSMSSFTTSLNPLCGLPLLLLPGNFSISTISHLRINSNHLNIAFLCNILCLK
ncbi:tissue factor pathway inhibitor a isoform X2 [Haplochromis burtoni]|uniref:tissue factor pathway inhibitor a isoform X2 n=1 Tax=Haplochromis burtoni TaxID=8153 RepID=UPI001C2D65E4|nr:tissue factor pathway inhibitor a isoform X2 [Haplochromis burtoni]